MTSMLNLSIKIGDVCLGWHSQWRMLVWNYQSHGIACMHVLVDCLKCGWFTQTCIKCLAH